MLIALSKDNKSRIARTSPYFSKYLYLSRAAKKLFKVLNSLRGTVDPKLLVKYLIIGIILWFGIYLYICFNWEPSTVFYWQLILSRLAIILFIFLTVLWISNHWRSFFMSRGSPFNLAVFRIIFFGYFTIGFLLEGSSFHEYLLHFVRLPESARISPVGMHWLISVLPINERILGAMTICFGLAAFGSTIGYKRKVSISIFVLTGLYLFAIPNLSGKINHNHHTIWIAAILIFSPCTERFSVDHWLKQKEEKAHFKNKNYQLPFNLIWILMVIIYFFPGFWKIWTSGLDWALTENVRNQMYWKWYEIGEWSPLLRIDQYPLLYRFAGLFTIAFELLFVWFIFNRKTRFIAALAGIIFHLGTFAFMNIFFVTLVIAYVSFINWEKLLPQMTSNSIESIEDKMSASIGIKIIGGLLIIGNLCFGVFKINSFPLTVYPSFDTITEDYTKTLSFSYADEEGQVFFLDKEILKKVYSSERYRNMEYQIIQAFENENLDSKAPLVRALISHLEIPQRSDVHISVDQVSVIPGSRGIVLDSQPISFD